MGNKEELYKRIKIAGLISYIPFILVAMPLAGYFTADFLKEKFGWNNYLVLILTGFGMLAGIRETFIIIKLAIKIEKSN